MNGYQSSARPFSERELDLQRVSDFHAVLLGMAAHDLRQPLQVIQSTYEWLSGRFDAQADRMRLQRGERAVARLAEQLVKAKIRRALLSGPDVITREATVAEMDAQGKMTVLRPGT
jgi:hypothetical protein